MCDAGEDRHLFKRFLRLHIFHIPGQWKTISKIIRFMERNTIRYSDCGRNILRGNN
nr:MAG TPA: hypothetical protein [Bacteriophage sp.]